MKYKLFLCPKCAGIMENGYITEEIPETFGKAKCEKCGKDRFGCKYEVHK